MRKFFDQLKRILLLLAAMDVALVLFPVTAYAGSGFFGANRGAVLVYIDKTNQQMTVSLDGAERYRWPVSTGASRRASTASTAGGSTISMPSSVSRRTTLSKASAGRSAASRADVMSAAVTVPRSLARATSSATCSADRPPLGSNVRVTQTSVRLEPRVTVGLILSPYGK